MQDPGVSWAQMTLAILTSKLTSRNETLDEIKDQYLEPFVQQNEWWCKKVSAFVLKKKKHQWADYKAEWLADAFPLDEIRITFFARCFRRYVCVFMNSHFWTTHVADDIGQCSIFLAYRGNMDFDDTQPMTEAQFKSSAEVIGCVQAKFDEAKLHEEQGMQLRSKRKRAYISDEDEDLDLEALLEQTSQKPTVDDNNMQKKIQQCSVILTPLGDNFNKKLNQNLSNKLDMKDNKGVDMKDNKGVDENKDSESDEGKAKRDNNLQNFSLSKKFCQQNLKRIKMKENCARCTGMQVY